MQLYEMQNAKVFIRHPGPWRIGVTDLPKTRKAVIFVGPGNGEPASAEVIQELAAYTIFHLYAVEKLHPIKQVHWFITYGGLPCSHMEMITFKQTGTVFYPESKGKFFREHAPAIVVAKAVPVAEFPPETELLWEHIRDEAVQSGLLN